MISSHHNENEGLHNTCKWHGRIRIHIHPLVEMPDLVLEDGSRISKDLTKFGGNGQGSTIIIIVLSITAEEVGTPRPNLDSDTAI
jgi:hypothetical protein